MPPSSATTRVSGWAAFQSPQVVTVTVVALEYDVGVLERS